MFIFAQYQDQIVTSSIDWLLYQIHLDIAEQVNASIYILPINDLIGSGKKKEKKDRRVGIKEGIGKKSDTERKN